MLALLPHMQMSQAFFMRHVKSVPDHVYKNINSLDEKIILVFFAENMGKSNIYCEATFII